MTTYGDISPITAAYTVRGLLERSMPYLCIEKFGQAKELPGNSTNTMKFRRYNALPLALVALTEGVTPPSKKLTKTDITAVLYQYGDVVELTDIIQDTHEDPVLKDAEQNMAEQAAKTVETIRYNTLIAGTNVFYANSVSARGSVVDVPSRVDTRKIVRALERQEAKHITTILSSSPDFNTENVQPGFIALCHVDCKTDIRSMTGFIDVKDYGQKSPFETEVGAVEDIRFLTSTIFTPIADQGGTTGAGSTKLSTGGANCDVYPILILAKDAYGITALKGKYAITPYVINPGTPTKDDPLGQRGYVSWKTMQGAVILNDMWMMRYEVACTL
jgi:N4-gp56 family major capsid protein